MNAQPTSPNHALSGFSVRRTSRACHGACEPPSPRQAPRQSRGLLALLDARTRFLRSKRRSGQRKRLDIRTDYESVFRHALLEPEL